MTCREKLAIEHPEVGNPVVAEVCPDDYGYLESDSFICDIGKPWTERECTKCWDREIPEKDDTEDIPPIGRVVHKNEENGGLTLTVKKPRILDSGNRRDFGTGAVRDMGEGKGRCDLMPLDVVGTIAGDTVYSQINTFLETGDETNLIIALSAAAIFSDMETMFLEVAKQFEDGCAKYGENNWRKGIPVKFYIDSAIRHYLKYRRGDKDEPHDRAFCWNILCAIWTYRHIPEMRGTIGNERNEHPDD